ncbi:hypothetical protein [Nocardia alba]|uniref:hypothetical protein n=1 Tax=Nocardia alba TaxID=225051 RepID=UPI001044882A|nr:hypothetical protein [Nocardia alba]
MAAEVGALSHRQPGTAAQTTPLAYRLSEKFDGGDDLVARVGDLAPTEKHDILAPGLGARADRSAGAGHVEQTQGRAVAAV